MDLEKNFYFLESVNFKDKLLHVIVATLEGWKCAFIGGRLSRVAPPRQGSGGCLAHLFSQEAAHQRLLGLSERWWSCT